MNVKDEENVKNTISLATKKFGRIDVVVNNAGFTHLVTIEEMSDADAREEFDINVFRTLNVIRNVLPQMKAQGSEPIFLDHKHACGQFPILESGTRLYGKGCET